MFVKTCWNTHKGKRYVRYYVAESYRHPENGKPRHRLLLNITELPDHVIQSIRVALQTGAPVSGDDLRIETGDALRGAGVLAIYRAWKTLRLDQVLVGLTPAQRTSVLLMVTHRILKPGSKRSLKEDLGDTLFAAIFPKKRLDEQELYRVMDKLFVNFYAIQEALRSGKGTAPERILCLYDITSTYFEGTEAEDGEYGHSRDKRWDRFQIVIGLVCDADGVPLALEVWPGNTADKTTVIDRVETLKNRFGFRKAIFVGDSGMYSEANVEGILKQGFDYILGAEWHTQRRELLALRQEQLELFAERGVVEWVTDGVRYVGCSSKPKRLRAASRRRAAMRKVSAELKRLKGTAGEAARYSAARLQTKVDDLLKRAGVTELWDIGIEPIDQGTELEVDDKCRLSLSFAVLGEAVRQAKQIEGKWLVATSVGADELTAEAIKQAYQSLQRVERAFRHIKSYLKIRPVYHYRRRRIRAHVLICFLAYYVVKKMELELREVGETREVERCLRDWDKLCLVEHTLQAGAQSRRDWGWSLGEVGRRVQADLQRVGWWPRIAGLARSLLK